MVNVIFSILDVTSEFYLPPQTAVTRAMAIRIFLEAATDPKTMISKYPDDYVLFELGSFKDSDASFKLHDAKISLGSARDLMPKAVEVSPIDISTDVSALSDRKEN